MRYRGLPVPGSRRRQAFDRVLAASLLTAMIVVNLSFWGPLPVAWLWIGSQVEYLTGSVSLGILLAFVGLLGTLLGALVILRQLDHTWILVRRAAGHDQRSGSIGKIFAITAAVGAIAFTVWLLIFAGLGPSLAPQS